MNYSKKNMGTLLNMQGINEALTALAIDGDELVYGNRRVNVSKFDIECFSSNALQKIDNNRFIIGGGNDNILNIISISENQIIAKISSIQCMGICVLKNKNIILIGGYSYDIVIYNSNNYQCLLYLKDFCINSIYGFKELNTGLIASYSCKNNIII